MREWFLGIIGFLCIAGGIIFNEWTLAALFSADGTIAASRRIIIWAIDLLLVSSGVALIRYRRVVKKETMLIMAGLVIIFAAVLIGELFIPALLGSALSKENRLFLRFSELLFLCAGSMVIICRRSVDLKSLLLLGSSVALCFVVFLIYDFSLSLSLLDRYTRVLDEHRMQDVHVGDAKLGWKPKAGSWGRHIHADYDVTYHIDQEGLKAIENNTDHPELSIWFFGDSFTFGAGVENRDTFATIIKDRHLTEEVNVINAGVMGYGITQMYARFLSVHDRIKDGDVIVFSPISEDINRSAHHPMGRFVLSGNSAFPLIAYPYFEKGMLAYRTIERPATVTVAPFLAPHTGIFWGLLYEGIFSPHTVRDSLAMMALVKERTEERGGRFVLIFLPTHGECKAGRRDVDVSRFAYCDVLRFFPSKEQEVDRLFFPTDRHYNAAGHALAAKAIVQTFVENKIIDKKYLKVPLQQ